MPVDGPFLRSLLDAADPLNLIWDRMVAIWEGGSSSEDIAAFYRQHETVLSQFEDAIYQGYHEIYDLLLERGKAQDGSYVRERLQGDSVVAVADSLSVREIAFLRRHFDKLGWRLSQTDYAIAAFPPLTDSLSEKLLGANPASGKDTSDFCYRYVAGPGEVPELPSGRPTVVWLRVPDKPLEQVTVAQTTTVADALKVTLQTLDRIMEQLGHRPLFITSDHGYLYATSPTHYWEMPGSTEDAARTVFPRESRAQPSNREGADDLLRQDRKEQRYFAASGTHVAIRGRFWWGSAGQNDRCTAHGGLSLAEGLVPVLHVTRTGSPTG